MKRETIELISWLQMILSLTTCSHKKELRSFGFRPLVPIKRRDHKGTLVPLKLLKDYSIY